MAVVINHSDPGAVPGASTICRSKFGRFFSGGIWWGRNRIDEGVKSEFLPGMVPPLSDHIIVANDNYAEARLAA